MAYSKQLSPGVQIREIDLTNFIPTTGTSGGAFVGQFVWGPVKEYTIINDANTLAKVFGKPTDSNYIDWFSAANFLSYADNLNLIRVVDSVSDSPAKNSSVDGTGMLIENKDAYQKLIASGQGVTEVFVAKYPGVIGDSLKISIADSNTFNSWTYKDEFDFAPGTSKFAKNLGAANDEVHIVVIDEDGKFTGIPGAILEKYAFLSKAFDSKGLDNEPNFYGNVINNSSKYVWYLGPVKGSLDLDIDSYVSNVNVTAGGSGYGKPLVRINGDGVGATATAVLGAGVTAGQVVGINVLNPGSGYSSATATIYDSGENAKAEAIVGTGANAGKIVSVIAIDAGQNYNSAVVTVTDQGNGAIATANLSATGSLKTVAVGAGGTGYSVSDSLTVSGGTGTFIVDTVDGGGSVLTGHIGVAGSGYATSGNGVSTTGGAGTGATVDIIVGKSVSTVSVTNQGTLYGSALVTLSGGNGTGAIATATVAGGHVIAIPVSAGGTGYETAPTVTIATTGTGATVTANLGATGSANEGKILSYTITNAGSGYGNPLVTVTPGGTGATATVSLMAGDPAETNWAKSCSNEFGVPRTFYSLKNNSADGTYSKGFSGGSDGQAATASDLIAGWNLFQNAEEVDVGLLFTGHAGGSTVSKVVIQHIMDNIVDVRRDCMVFISPNLRDVLNLDQVTATQNIIKFIQDPVTGINRDTSFGFCDSGWKLQYDVFADKYRWIPLNADIAGLAALTETNYDAWWSIAGLNRGKVKNVVSLAFNPNRSSRDQLYKANINSVVSFTGEGTVLYGDKTMQVKNSAFSFINVRRLFIVLEKAIGKAAKYQLFEFNDTFTRSQFVGIVEPYLRSVKAKRGVYDFKVICNESNNTPDVIDRAEFIASIFIKPARSINFITLNFIAARTGIEFSEIVGAV